MSLLFSVWHKHRKRFTAIKASKAVGKLTRLAEGAPWVYALAQNKYTLETSSSEFQELTKIFKRKDFKGRVHGPRSGDHSTVNEHKIVRFALEKAARMVHHVPMEYNIVPSMREKLDFLRSI